MKAASIRTNVVLLLLILCVYSTSVSAGKPDYSQLLKTTVPDVRLDDQDIVDALAMLSSRGDFGISVEFPLTKNVRTPRVRLTKFTTILPGGRLEDVLNRLCALDPVFSWTRYSSSINVMPAAAAKDETYFLNKRVPELAFNNSTDAQEAVFTLAAQIPGGKQQIAVLQTGGSLSFAKPFSAKFVDITVRDALDLIAEQLGQTYGWQFGGSEDFRVITFHARLLAKEPDTKK